MFVAIVFILRFLAYKLYVCMQRMGLEDDLCMETQITLM